MVKNTCSYKDIQILANIPKVEFCGIYEKYNDLKYQISVSISHDRDYAQSFCTVLSK